MALSIVNARIYTGEPHNAWAHSVRIRDGVFDECDGVPLDGDTVLDAGGKLLMPSFGDGHAHPMLGGFEFLGPSISGRESVEDIVARVRYYAAMNPDLDWIVGGSYESSIASNGEFDARWLDDAVADRPVVLRANDYHTIWCNTLALEKAGISSETPDPELGWIVRRPDGTPMGTLREWDAVDLVMTKVPPFSVDDKIRAIEIACRELTSTGITWVQDAWVDPDMVDAYLEADRRGSLSIRFNLALRADPRAWREQLGWFEETRESIGTRDRLTCNSIKFFADGVIEGATAAVADGYTTDPHNHGMPVWDWEELRLAVAAVDALGFQPHIHAIGDEGLTEALNAIEHAQSVNGVSSQLRPVITHVQLLDPTDIPRFASLGVIANFQPLWACDDSTQRELTTPRLGHERASWQYPMRSLIESGCTLSMGSDWPVSSHNPLECLEVAVTRIVPGDESGSAWIPSERIALTDAISAYTTGNAIQAGLEEVWGRISPGLSADFVMLSANVFELTPTDIHTAVVERTWCQGVEVFRRNNPKKGKP